MHIDLVAQFARMYTNVDKVYSCMTVLTWATFQIEDASPSVRLSSLAELFFRNCNGSQVLGTKPMFCWQGSCDTEAILGAICVCVCVCVAQVKDGDTVTVGMPLFTVDQSKGTLQPQMPCPLHFARSDKLLVCFRKNKPFHATIIIPPLCVCIRQTSVATMSQL